MQFNNEAQTCWGILGDQLSMTSPQDKQLACLPGSRSLEESKRSAQPSSPRWGDRGGHCSYIK